jgi:hypothetical protein
VDEDLKYDYLTGLGDVINSQVFDLLNQQGYVQDIPTVLQLVVQVTIDALHKFNTDSNDLTDNLFTVEGPGG